MALFPLQVTTLLLLGGLALLAAGYLWGRREGHLVIATGWIVLGLYWPTQAGQFLAAGDIVNAAFTLLAMPFFFYLAYHEGLSYQREEDPRGLRWIAGTAAVAGGLYMLFHQWTPAARFMIETVATQTVWLLNLSNPGYVMGAFVPVEGASSGSGAVIGSFSGAYELAPGYVPIQMTNEAFYLPDVISIVLACTAMQAISIFAGAIAVAPAKLKPKVYAFLGTVPVIYGLNLLRNWGIIYGVDVLAYDFDVMHNWIGKGGSLVALIGLAVFTFEMLPEVHEAILEVVDLPKRDGPLEDGLRRLLGIEAGEEPA